MNSTILKFMPLNTTLLVSGQAYKMLRNQEKTDEPESQHLFLDPSENWGSQSKPLPLESEK
jgi:hypothetical protein